MCIYIKYKKILGPMAWDYYNLTQGHCLKGVGHLSWECMTFGFREQNICLKGVEHVLKVQDICLLRCRTSIFDL